MPDEPNWRDNLSDDLKTHKSLADFKDVGGLAQSFVDTLALQGTSIRVPGPEAGEDAWKAFHTKLTDKVPNLIPMPDVDNAETMSTLYNKLGRPEDATKYEHPKDFDATKMADFAAAAHELGMSNKQYLGLVTKLQEFTVTQTEAASTAFMEGIRGLKQEWGITYEDNLQLIGSVMKGTEAPAMLQEMAADGKLDADTQKWLFNIGKQLGTEGINFNKDEFSTRVAPAEAKARVAEIMGDRSGPYWDASHPQHRDYVQRVVDLNRAAAAGTR